VCDNPLFLGEEERGLLFDPLDPESIADAIVRFHGMSASARAAMARRARLFAQQHLSVDRMVDSYEALLKGETDVHMRAIG